MGRYNHFNRWKDTSIISNLIGALIGLARATEGNEELITSSTISIITKTLNHIKSNETKIIPQLINEIEIEKKKLIPLCYECKTKCGRNDAYNFSKVLDTNNEVSKIKLQILDNLIELASKNINDEYTITLIINSLFLLFTISFMLIYTFQDV